MERRNGGKHIIGAGLQDLFREPMLQSIQYDINIKYPHILCVKKVVKIGILTNNVSLYLRFCGTDYYY